MSAAGVATRAAAEEGQQRGHRVLIAIVVLGVILRVAAIGALGTHNTSLYEFGVIGGNLTHDRGYTYFAASPNGTVHIDASRTGRTLPSAFMPPGYTIVVAGAQAVGHSDHGALRLLQVFNVVVGAVTILLTYLLATLVFSRRAGLWSALAVAVYPVLLYQATQSSASNAYLPVDLLTLYLLARTVRRPSRALGAWAGVGLGITCLFRAEALLLIPLFAIWLGWAAWRRLDSTPRRACTTTAMVVLFLVPAIGIPGLWMVRNSVVLHHVTPDITTTGGFNLWIGNHAGATGSQKQYPAPTGSLERELNSVPATSDYEAVRDSKYMSAAVTYIEHHPGTTAARDLKKLGMTLTLDVYDHRSRNVLYVGSWLVLVILGVWGFLRRQGARRSRPARALPPVRVGGADHLLHPGPLQAVGGDRVPVVLRLCALRHRGSCPSVA